MNRLISASLLLVTGMQCGGSIVLSISPSTQSVPLGSPASFAVDTSGLGNGKALGGYDLNVGFDPSVLSYKSIVFGNQLDISGLGDIQTVTPGVGTIEVFELSLDSASELNSLQAPAFALATLTFATIATASNSPLTLSINALGDAYGNSISPEIGDATVSVVSVTAVPEPKSSWPMAAALMVVAWFLKPRRLFGFKANLRIPV